MRLAGMLGVLVVAGCVRAGGTGGGGPAPFRFAVVGDRTDEPNDAAWRKILADVAARRPELVLTVGDLVDDALDPADWDTALAPTAVLGAPVAFTPGNHDILDEATAATFEARTGQAPHRAFDHGGVHFVVVDNAIPEAWDAVPDDQRAWLEDTLAELARDGAPVVVSMHKPFWALGAAVGAPDPLHALFVAHGVDAVFTGHWHAHLYQRIDGIDYVGVGTSGGAHGGLQDWHVGNAYEYVWVEVVDGALAMRAVAGDVDLPVDYVTRADRARLRELQQGAVSAVARDGAIAISVRNPGGAPLSDVFTIAPGAWRVAATEVPFAVAPGETFTASIPAEPGPDGLPSPRITLPYPLPDAGMIPYTFVVDVVRTVDVHAGSAVIDGALGEWEGTADIGPLTTSAGLPAATDPTWVKLRHDDEALYLAARCADPSPGELHRLHAGRDGNAVYDDRIGLLAWPTPGQLVWFYVTPNGAVWDLLRTDGKVDLAWNGVEAAASIDATGWSVEVRLPYASLGLGPGRAELPNAWPFDVRRRQVHTQTEATFTSAFGARDPTRAGVLRLVP